MAKSKVRMSIRWKIFLLVGTLISVGVFFVLMRTSDIFKKDKTAFVKELNQKLTASLAKNLSNRISSIQDKLVIFISSRESLAQTGIKLDDQLPVLFARYSDFLAIGFLKPDGADFKAEWVLKNPSSAAKKWPADMEKAILKNLDLSKAKENGRGFWKGTGPDGKPLILLGYGVQVIDAKKKGGSSQPTTAWIMGVLPSTAFDDLVSEYSAGLNTAFIVDDKGSVLSHSDISSSWKDFSNHPLVAEIMKGRVTSSTGDYKDEKGRAIIGSFEDIPNINLAMVMSTPRDKAFEAANVLLNNILATGAGILLLALCAAIILANLLTGPLQKLASAAAQIGEGNFNVKIDVQTTDEIGDLAESFTKMGKGLIDRDEALAQAQSALVQSEKMGAFGQISAGIAHEVKNPLAGILGHAQLALGKAPNEDLKKHLEVIEKETRRCKTIVENLMRFARQEKAVMEPTDLATVIQDTINLVDHQLSLAGCKIVKEFSMCSHVEANSNQLQQVLLNLMVNASHAMEKAEKKIVTVRLLQVGDKAQIQIEDTGSGIPPEIQKKIFEPFFTTKPAGKGTGLGLSVSIGIVKEHKGEIYLKSEMGRGTTFFIDFPVLKSGVAAVSPTAKKPVETQQPAPSIVPTSMGPAPSMTRNQPPPPISNPKKSEPTIAAQPPQQIIPTSMGPHPVLPRNQPPSPPANRPSFLSKLEKKNVERVAPIAPESRLKGDEEFFTTTLKPQKVELPPIEDLFFGSTADFMDAEKNKGNIPTPSPAPEPEVKKSEPESDDGLDFKVKVKRPKLKV